MSSKIANVRTLTIAHHKLRRNTRPTPEAFRVAIEAAAARGVLIDDNDGRCYAPWKANVRGMRWEKGKLVPRHARTLP